MKTQSPLAAEWPPGGPPTPARSAAAQQATTDFGALLTQHEARTATAEGQNRDGSREIRSDGDRRRSDERTTDRSARGDRPQRSDRRERTERRDDRRDDRVKPKAADDRSAQAQSSDKPAQAAVQTD